MDYNFIEVIQNFERMCKRYDFRCDLYECPIAALINEWEKENKEVWEKDCIFFALEEPEAFSNCVTNWARENPIVYPTTRDIINKIRALMQVDESRVKYEEFLDMPLNKTAAEYFGITPINENKLV